jgi:hypothetical protein
MYNQGVPFTVPLWVFVCVVFLPVFGAIIAEILIWFKNKDPYR